MNELKEHYNNKEEFSMGLVSSLGMSIFNPDTREISIELAEIEIDKIFENEILKDIPIVRSVSVVCKAGIYLREKHLIKQTLHFIIGFNQGKLSEKKLNKYRSRIMKNDTALKKELERVIFLLDSHISDQQSQRLGAFYVAYTHGEITWEEFCELEEVNLRMFEADIQVLQSIDEDDTKDYSKDYHAARLFAIGLLLERGAIPKKGVRVYFNEKNYTCSALGKMFLQYSKKVKCIE